MPDVNYVNCISSKSSMFTNFDVFWSSLCTSVLPSTLNSGNRAGRIHPKSGLHDRGISRRPVGSLCQGVHGRLLVQSREVSQARPAAQEGPFFTEQERLARTYV